MEDVFPLTYLQGVSITVHMDEKDDVFVRRDKMYIADFSEWIVDKEDRVREMHTGLSLMTIALLLKLRTCKSKK